MSSSRPRDLPMLTDPNADQAALVPDVAASPENPPSQRDAALESGMITVPSSGHAITFRPVESDEEILKLFKQLSPIQQQILNLREAGDTNIKACERAGIATATLSAWLSESGGRYSEPFRRLWYTARFSSQIPLLMERYANLFGLPNLMRIENVAANAAEQWDHLSAAKQTNGLRAMEKLVDLPIKIAQGKQESSFDWEEELVLRIRQRRKNAIEDGA